MLTVGYKIKLAYANQELLYRKVFRMSRKKTANLKKIKKFFHLFFAFRFFCIERKNYEKKRRIKISRALAREKEGLFRADFYFAVRTGVYNIAPRR